MSYLVTYDKDFLAVPVTQRLSTKIRVDFKKFIEYFPMAIEARQR
ncbi:2867_t:CDS:2 [Entrophospora sp. SA101]|nr:2867_t:CDS:2 [Entrophospora sp. SA101]